MPLRRNWPFAALILLACGGGGPSRPPVASISLTPATTAALTSLGDTLLLTATAHDAGGAPIPGVGIVYTSSDAAVATVTQSGLVTAVANGAATIHASAEGKEATIAILVAQVVAHVLVTPSGLLVPPGEVPLFHASAVDARSHAVVGAPAPVWTTTDPAVATIAADGRAAVSPTAATGATVSAIATVGAVPSTAGGAMTVDPSAIYVETISLAAAGATSFSSLNQTVQLSATATNPHGDVTSQVTFAWSSTAPTVAGVSTSGFVTALGNGNAAVSASWNGVSGSLPIAVAQVVSSVSVKTQAGGTSAPLASLGETVQLVATASDAGGSPVAGAAFAWTSDAPSVAVVGGTGVVTAVANGSAHVVARATGNQVAAPAFAVTVQQAVASVSVLPPTASIPRCATQQFAAVPRDARGNAVAGAPAASWSPATGTVATVNASGLATAVNVGGPVTITAKVSGVSGTAQLTVNSSPVVVSWNASAATTPVNVTICAGQAVVWRNTDTDMPHTATGNPAPPPDTGDIQPGASSVPQTFSSSGQYHYGCIYHLSETGIVTVTP
ncbi:MAG: Ig-like domain-containing protein [Myxococcales bacterium]